MHDYKSPRHSLPTLTGCADAPARRSSPPSLSRAGAQLPECYMRNNVELNLVAGDIVRLKSGSCKMVVLGYGEYCHIRCGWIAYTSQEPQEAEYPVAALKLEP